MVRLLPSERFARIGFDLCGEWQIRCVGSEPSDCAFQNVGARVTNAVDAMAETHEALATRKCIIDPRFDSLAGPNGVEHFQDGFWRSAVQWTGKRAISSRDRGEQVGLRRCDHAGSKG